MPGAPVGQLTAGAPLCLPAAPWFAHSSVLAAAASGTAQASSRGAKDHPRLFDLASWGDVGMVRGLPQDVAQQQVGQSELGLYELVGADCRTARVFRQDLHRRRTP